MKKAPPLSQQPHFISWGPVKPPPIENLIGGSIPLFPAASDVIISFKGSCIFLLDTKKKERKKNDPVVLSETDYLTRILHLSSRGLYDKSF